MLICYKDKQFSNDHKALIGGAVRVIDEYRKAGYTLTLRQLYYQFVSRNWIENKQTEYKRLGAIITAARLAGLVDWRALEDRTRNVRYNYHLRDAQHALQDAHDTFLINKWLEQPEYVEVWIEKDALIGVIEPICRQLDVPFFSCRGYVSSSEAWRAGHDRMKKQFVDNAKPTTVIHLGDHDPSGLDMTWDIWKRLNMFVGLFDWDEIESRYTRDEALITKDFTVESGGVAVKRVALNMEQIRKLNLPPNPTKAGDVRSTGYERHYGRECWELDALDPPLISKLIQDAVGEHRDEDIWQASLAEEQAGRDILADFIEKMEGMD